MGGSLLLTSHANQVWQVFLLYGVGFSLGVSGCCNAIASAITTNWFVKKRGLALGLVMSGLGVGQLIMIPANLFIIERLGWRDTMTTISIIIMVVVGPLFVFCLRSGPGEKGMRPYGYADDSGDEIQNDAHAVTNKDTLPVVGLFKHRAFWLVSITYFICGFTDMGLIQTHLIPIVGLKGFPVSAAALAFSLIAISNIAGTIVTGYLSDHFSRPRLLAAIYCIRAVAYIFLIAIKRPWQIPVFAVINGSVDMASIAPTNSLVVQLFDRYQAGIVLAIVAISHQMGGAAGAWVPGLLYDMTGSYFAVLTLSAVILFGGALIALRIPDKASGVV
jgi:sugar phosphate permease